LAKIWKSLDAKLCESLAQRVILLFDCDVETQDANRGRVAKRVIPTVSSNPIHKGIENLFTANTINKARAHNPKFIDVTPEIRRTVRGEEAITPELLEINRDEKKNLCTWICENGILEDFVSFDIVFNLMVQALTLKPVIEP
jgi:hypothetical protein